MTWNSFPHYWTFVRGIHQLLVDSPHKWASNASGDFPSQRVSNAESVSIPHQDWWKWRGKGLLWSSSVLHIRSGHQYISLFQRNYIDLWIISVCVSNFIDNHASLVCVWCFCWHLFFTLPLIFELCFCALVYVFALCLCYCRTVPLQCCLWKLAWSYKQLHLLCLPEPWNLSGTVLLSRFQK